ncbi:eukaryotic-like serine/threonine-protein kinase [Phycisphaerales bacterium]|nr:eukaryotic-like serine/threonine-protein kinase [Phycisphaerales bacterium]
MSPKPLSREEHAQAGELFERARVLPPGTREREIRDAPGYVPRARQEALALLAHLPPDEFLLRPAGTPGAIEQVLREVTGEDPRGLIGARVGAFRVEALLGVGGMGAVYRAVDTRSGEAVALKVLRTHAMSHAAIARLEREARVLSRMQHPCIARMLSVGTAGDDGRPFFAMELLEGALPVTAWVRANRIDCRGVLALFVRVCEAVHHGHQRGVIHRDLKPQNILVLPDGTPKLIDFGVAFATDADMSRVSVSTGVGALVGTFAYMSPEQCEGDPAGVDTRSDVYALGVVLYELLAGERPHDLDGRPLAEVIRVIRSGATGRLESVRPELAGDVATIVRKAMDPSPDQRYVSVADLSQDVSRFLSNRPIEARPAGSMHHLRLLWRRQRVAVTAAGIAAACVVGAGVVSVLFGVRARGEENRAKAALVKEADARERSERMTAFLQGAIGSANPYQPREVSPALLSSSADPWAEWMFSPWNFAGVDGGKATVEDVLASAAKRLPVEFQDDPEAHAQLAETLGVTLFRLERREEARVLLERCVELRLMARGEQDDASIRAMMRVAAVYDTVRLETALVWWKRAYEQCVGCYGVMDPRTLRAERMYAFAVHASDEDGAGMLLRTVPPPAPGAGPLPPEHLLHLAFAALMMSAHFDYEAAPIAEEVLRRLEAGEADGDPLARVLARRSAVGAVLACGAEIESVRPHVRLLEGEARELFGAWSPEYMNTMGSPMISGIEDRPTEESAAYFAQAAAAQLRLRGRDHWETGNALYAASYAIGKVDAKSPGAADSAGRVIAALREFPQGISTPGVVAECVLARIDLAAGKTASAMERLEAVLRRVRAPQAPALQPQAWARLHTVRGECFSALGKPEEADLAFREAVATAAKFRRADEGEEWTKDARKHLAGR